MNKFGVCLFVVYFFASFYCGFKKEGWTMVTPGLFFMGNIALGALVGRLSVYLLEIWGKP